MNIGMMRLSNNQSNAWHSMVTPAPHEIAGQPGLYVNDKKHLVLPELNIPIMSRNLYSPRLSDDVVRALYREGQRRRMPMTRLADELLRQSFRTIVNEPVLRVCEDVAAPALIREADAA